MAGASTRGGLLRLAAAAAARGAAAGGSGGGVPPAAAAASHRGVSPAAAATAAGLRRVSGCGGSGGGGFVSRQHPVAGGNSRRSTGRWVTVTGAVPVIASGRLVAPWGPLRSVRRGLATSLPAAASASASASVSASVVAAAVEEGGGVLGRAVAAGPAAGVGGVAGGPPPPPSPPPPPPLPPVSVSGGSFGSDAAGRHPPVGEAAWLTSTIPDPDAAAAAAAAAATAAAGAPPSLSTTLPAGADVATPAAAVTDVAGAAAPAATDAAAASPGVLDYLLLPIKATLEAAHTMTGLPWWATIALTTLAFRTLLLPVSLRVNRRAHRARLLQPRIKELQAAVLQAAQSGDRTAQAARQATMMAFMNKHGVSPVGTLKDMAVQMPIFLGFFAAINRMVATNTPGLSTEGALWFVDLTVRDAFYGLPLLTGLTTAVMVGAGGDGANAMAPAARKGMMAIGLLIVPLSAYFPAALFCYWLPSNLVSLAVAMALKRPAVRSAAGFDLPPEAAAAGAAIGGGAAAGGGGPALMSPAEAAASYLRRKGGGEAVLTPGRPVVLLKAPPAKGRRRQPPGGSEGDAPARRS